MKKLLLIPVLFLLLISCSNNSDEETQPNLLIGEWKLSEVFYSDGDATTTTTWVPITDGYTFVFLEGNKFYSTKFLGISGCTSGTYTVANGVITLTFYCPSTANPNKFKINTNTSNELIISDINCLEFCADKLTKIN